MKPINVKSLRDLDTNDCFVPTEDYSEYCSVSFFVLKHKAHKKRTVTEVKNSLGDIRHFSSDMTVVKL